MGVSAASNSSDNSKFPSFVPYLSLRPDRSKKPSNDEMLFICYKRKEMQLIMPDFDARSAFRNPVKKGKKIFETL